MPYAALAIRSRQHGGEIMGMQSLCACTRRGSREKGYESEVSRFINELKHQHPDLEVKQREARALWWERPPIDLEEMERRQQSEVPFKPYL
jgi:hypothetical protein